MKPKIYGWHSPDPEFSDLEAQRLIGLDDFGFLLSLAIGPQEPHAGVDNFDIVVCTPKWLAREVKESKPLLGRHLLIVERYDLDIIRKYLRRHIGNCVGETWEEIALKINAIAGWDDDPERFSFVD